MRVHDLAKAGRDLGAPRQSRVHPTTDDRRLEGDLLHDSVEIDGLEDGQLEYLAPARLRPEA